MLNKKEFWILFLIIGLIASCTDRQPVNNQIYYIYNNQTNENVELKLYNSDNDNFKSYLIPTGQEIQISLYQNGGKGVGTPFRFDNEITERVVIRFVESDKCLENYYKILNSNQYDNYLQSMENMFGNVLMYNIDEEEFSLATNCQ